MLSWGERGKRKWGGPGVNGAGWEARLAPLTGPLRPGCKTLGFVSLSLSPFPVTEGWSLGTDAAPETPACL